MASSRDGTGGPARQESELPIQSQSQAGRFRPLSFKSLQYFFALAPIPVLPRCLSTLGSRLSKSQIWGRHPWGTLLVPRDSHRVKRTLDEVKNQTHLSHTQPQLWGGHFSTETQFPHLEMGGQMPALYGMHRVCRNLGGFGEGIRTQAQAGGYSMTGSGELRSWGALQVPRLSTAPAFKPRPLSPAWPEPPGRGPARVEGAQAEPEQSPAGRQGEGPGQLGGNSQAWGRRAGRQGPSSGPLTPGEVLNFLPQLPQLWTWDRSPVPPDGETVSSTCYPT